MDWVGSVLTKWTMDKSGAEAAVLEDDPFQASYDRRPRFRLNTYGRRAFSVAGPMAWNSLPDFIRDPTSSTDHFRRLLKTYLFARY